MKKELCAVLFLIVASTLTGTATAGDARRGEMLARSQCASCHRVAPDQRTSGGRAPDFADIPRFTALDEIRLALYLMLSHPRMPNLPLPSADAFDVAAYITVLGARRPAQRIGRRS